MIPKGIKYAKTKKKGIQTYYYCECGKYVNKSYKYCPECASRIEWEKISDEDVRDA